MNYGNTTKKTVSAETSALDRSGAIKPLDPPSRSNETTAEKSTRIDTLGTTRFNNGVIQVATGITQLSLAEQDRQENGASEEGNQLRERALQNIGRGTNEIDNGRAIVNHANKIRSNENRHASVGTTAGLSLHDLKFDRSGASAHANDVLDEMEKTAGVPAATLINAINSGGGRDQVVNIAGGAKAVEFSEAQIVASMPSFPVSDPTAMSDYSFAGAMKDLGGVLPQNGAGAGVPALAAAAAASAERKAASSEKPPAVAVAGDGRKNPATEEENIRSLGTDQLLASMGAKDSELAQPDGSLFQRVSKQYSKRLRELASAVSAR